MSSIQSSHPTVLITGASGLLGRALVHEFTLQGFRALAQYHLHPPITKSENTLWLPGDFSTLQGIRDFLLLYTHELQNCKVLINNFGPITYKDINELKGEDFSTDYFLNVVPAFEITDYLLKHSTVKVVINIGFEYTGAIRPYRKILTYAAAKNALLLLTQSFQKNYPQVHFTMIPLPSLAGAAVPAENKIPISPTTIAKEIVQRVWAAGQTVSL